MDLTFKTEEGRFNFRVGAIIIHNNKLLMATNNISPYYWSIGGRVKYNESVEQAIQREVKEELGFALEIVRTVYFVQKFFDEEITKEHFHEVAVYFLMKDDQKLDDIKTGQPILTDEIDEQNGAKIVWLDLNELDKYTIYPKFFRTELSNLPENLRILTEIQ